MTNTQIDPKRTNGGGLEPSPSVLRKAIPEDYEDILRLFLQSYSENAVFQVSPKKVQFFIERALYPEMISPEDLGPRGIIAVIGDPGRLEAIVFVTISEEWYSDQPYIEEMMVYVDPEYRKSNHANAIIEYLKQQSDLTGLPLRAGIVATHRTEAKCKLYRRKLPKMGEYFLKMPQKSGTA